MATGNTSWYGMVWYGMVWYGMEQAMYFEIAKQQFPNDSYVSGFVHLIKSPDLALVNIALKFFDLVMKHVPDVCMYVRMYYVLVFINRSNVQI